MNKDNFLTTFLAAVLLTAICLSFCAAQDNPKKKKQQPLPPGVEVIRDIEYAMVDGHSLKLDVYRPFDWADYDNTPVVIWVHGGGWKNGSKDRCPAVYLAQDNLAVVSINYRLIDAAQWPSQINDCYAAVRWVRKNAKTYGFGEKIGVWGGSAGGHLVALMGTRDFDGKEDISSKVQAVCDFYGPSDLLTMPPNMIANGRTREQVEQSNGAKLLGKTVIDVPVLARDASALHQVTKGGCALSHRAWRTGSRCPPRPEQATPRKTGSRRNRIGAGHSQGSQARRTGIQDRRSPGKN